METNIKGDPGSPAPPHSQRLRRWMLPALAVIAVGAAIALPLLNRASVEASQHKCSQQLRAIGDTFHLYASENQGQLPPSLAALVSTQDFTTGILVCPASQDTPATSVAAVDQPGGSSYVYVRAGSHLTTLPSTAVLLYEPVARHGKTTNVLRIDRSVTPTTAEEMNALRTAGNLPPAP